MKIQNKAFKEVNVHDISKLFHTVWDNQDYDEIVSKTNWAFFNGNSKVVLFEDNDHLVAARGSFQWPLSYNNIFFKTYQFHGTCVHPNYRRKGIFTSINKQFLEEAQNDKFDLIFNVSVDNSRAGYEKLGWIYLKGFRRMTYVNTPTNFIKKNIFKRELKEKLDVDEKISKNFLTNRKEIIPGEFLLARKEHFKDTIHTDYSSEFLEWRLNDPLSNYKIHYTDKCIIIYKLKFNKGLRELIIGDFFMLEKKYNIFKNCLKSLIKIEKPNMTYTYIFNKHPYFRYYERFFFLPNPLNYNLNFGCRTLNEETKQIIKFKKWGIGFLDIDTF